MWHKFVIAPLVFAAAAGAQTKTPSSEPAAKTDPSAIHSHRRVWKYRLFSTDAVGSALITTAWSEAWNTPKEWGRTWKGAGYRLSSAYGNRAVRATVELGIETWTHENTRYRRSGRHGFMPRAKYAVARTFWVPRDNGPGYTVPVGRIAGAFTAGQVSRLWLPERINKFHDGVETGLISVSLDAVFNVAREFFLHRH